MKKGLFIDCCMREDSRTRALALQELGTAGGFMDTLVLTRENLVPMDWETLLRRNEAANSGDLTHPLLKYAVQFAAADEIVIAAPYWDLTFPALLKVYLEYVCVVGVTFRYVADNQAEGLCRARKLTYITTSGGASAHLQLGYEYVRQLCREFFGIPETRLIFSENLDIPGAVPQVYTRP